MQLKRICLLTATATTATTTVSAKYTIIKDYSGYDFVSGFDYYNGPDPTNGHVQYKGYATANATGLTGFLIGSNGTNIYNSTLAPPVYLGVDNTNTYPTHVGRPSVRVSSVQTFNHSLVIADILHMPSSTCGLWPAFWMLGTAAPWPNAGEIDIIENVNDNNFNLMSLHTSEGVVVSNDTTLFNGTMKTTNCDVKAKDQEKNVGCGVKDNSEVNSYGTNFNNIHGGVFAMQYTPEHIAIWFFPRKAIPTDIKLNTPSPPSITNASGSAWGKPNALFKSPMPTSTLTSTSTSSSSSSMAKPTGNVIIPISNISSPPTNLINTTNFTSPSLLSKHFTSLQLLFSTTFCGEWAGKVWNATSCGKLAPTCEEYVSKNPAAFRDAYWAIQSVKVFTDNS